jgi:hypothetical protein
MGVRRSAAPPTDRFAIASPTGGGVRDYRPFNRPAMNASTAFV